MRRPASPECRAQFPTRVIVHRDTSQASAAVTIEGTATGALIGGNLDAVRTDGGAGLPKPKGAILFLEHQRGTGLGEVDRALTQLTRTGALDGLRGVVLGRRNADGSASRSLTVDRLAARPGRRPPPELSPPGRGGRGRGRS